MKIDVAACPYPLSDALLAILENEIDKSGVSAEGGAVLTFRDPAYSAATGGFHPVEVSISAGGAILYITDLAYVGTGAFADLAKEVDFDFSLGLFQHVGREYPLEHGLELYSLWEQNFISYYRMGVYAVNVDSA